MVDTPTILRSSDPDCSQGTDPTLKGGGSVGSVPNRSREQLGSVGISGSSLLDAVAEDRVGMLAAFTAQPFPAPDWTAPERPRVITHAFIIAEFERALVAMGARRVEVGERLTCDLT